MILVLRQGTARDKVDALCELLEGKYRIQTNPIYGSEQTVVGLVGDTSRVPESDVAALDEVDRVVKVQVLLLLLSGLNVLWKTESSESMKCAPVKPCLRSADSMCLGQ